MNLFPQSTKVGTKIPKQKFYDNLTINPALKRSFVDDVSSIVWENKLAQSTMNVLSGDNVLEIEVFRIVLNNKDFNENILRQMDKQIPYHILFILEFQNEYCLCVSNKETSSGDNAFKVFDYYRSGWSEEIQINLDGLNLDTMYENLITQIGDIKIEEGLTLHEQIASNEERERIKKQIEKLERQAKKEKQPRFAFEIHQEIIKLKKQLGE